VVCVTAGSVIVEVTVEPGPPAIVVLWVMVLAGEAGGGAGHTGAGGGVDMLVVKELVVMRDKLAVEELVGK